MATKSTEFHEDLEVDKSTLVIPNLKKVNGKVTNEKEVKNTIFNVIYYMFRYNALAMFTPGGIRSPIKREPVLIMTLSEMYDHDILQTLMTRDREQYDVLMDWDYYVNFESWKKVWDLKDKELIAATYIPYYMIWEKERMRRFYSTQFGATIEDLGHDFTKNQEE
ncbi:MAG: hypothetical protein GF353_05280 [Candidatus Lokiarchaeota archaeon]|nr:hypothetical protein [Candidatus Lokiarchaeota archaeon]